MTRARCPMEADRARAEAAYKELPKRYGRDVRKLTALQRAARTAEIKSIHDVIVECARIDTLTGWNAKRLEVVYPRVYRWPTNAQGYFRPTRAGIVSHKYRTFGKRKS